MFCTNCGTQAAVDTKFCTNCGKVISVQEVPSNPASPSPLPKSSIFQKINKSALAKVLVGVLIVGAIIYSSIDDNAVETNNEAINAYNSGDSKSAISQFETASQSALTDETKVDTLKNLAYAYSTEGQNDQALAKFKEALPLTQSGSLDNYLLQGEIAYLEGKPSIAIQHYNKAYAIDPNDFQINNALALFYMDAEDLYPQYVDYPKALGYARKAQSTNNTALTLGNLGAALVLNEKYQEALTYLNQVNIQQHPYIHLWLGLAYLGLENEVEAKSHLRLYQSNGGELPSELAQYIKN